MFLLLAPTTQSFNIIHRLYTFVSYVIKHANYESRDKEITTHSPRIQCHYLATATHVHVIIQNI